MNNNTAIAPESTMQANYNVTTEELDNFVAALSKRHNDGLRAAYPTCTLNWEIVTAELGKRYARLVSSRPACPDDRSAMGFIDLTNGDILKAAGWKTPAKHARGNIRKGDVSNLWNGAFSGAYGGLHVSYLR